MNPLLHTSKGLRLLVVAVACCAAVLAGCSDDESSEATTTSAAAETEETTSEDDSTDTVPEVTLPDTPLCQLAAEESPDLSGLPDLLPEELRAEATQFAEEYNAWRESEGEAAPPDAPEGVVTYITQECTPALDDLVEPDAPAG